MIFARRAPDGWEIVDPKYPKDGGVIGFFGIGPDPYLPMEHTDSQAKRDAEESVKILNEFIKQENEHDAD